MSSISRVQTFCFPLPGKPAKDADFKLGKDRLRITQPAQKGDTCWLYAMHQAGRKRYGKTAPENLEQRKDEKAISTLRKKISLLSRNDSSNHINLYKEHLDHLGVRFDIEKEAMDLRMATAKACTYYMMHKNKLRSEEKEDLFKQNLNKCSQHFNTSNSSTQHSILHQFVIKDSYQRFGFKEAAWDPTCTLNVLIQSLKKYGPHVVGGLFAGSYYKVPPFELPIADQIEGRPVYGWKKNDPHYDIHSRSPDLIGHAIVIVGAARNENGKEYIYFLNPMDESKPAPFLQKTYIISYERFTENILPLNAIHNPIINQDNILTTIHFNKIPSSVTSLSYAIYNTLY